MLTEKELLARARELRRNPTEWEIRVWRHLSNSQMNHKFRRQHVIFPYICDFFCPAKALIVEIDGDTHDADADRKRDAYLAAKGFKTVRFTNLDVRENIDGMIARVAGELARRRDRWPRLPHPNPAFGRSGSQPDLNRAGRGLPNAPEGEGLSP